MPDPKITAQYLMKRFACICSLRYVRNPAQELAYIYESLTDIGGTTKKVNCFMVPEPLQISHGFWEFYSVNRKWIGKSISRIEASGLIIQWNEWSVWAEKVYFKLCKYEHQRSLIVGVDHNDFIDFKKLSIIFVVWVSGCLLGILFA